MTFPFVSEITIYLQLQVCAPILAESLFKQPNDFYCSIKVQKQVIKQMTAN